MRIGLVLPELPQYSETFFNYKIQGLIEYGHDITVFTARGKSDDANRNYKVVRANPTEGKNPVSLFLYMLLALAEVFMKSPSKAKNFIRLEKQDGKNLKESVKSLYLNTHIINENIDRLHFGFATTALKRENVAAAIGAGMSVSFRGFDINIYPLKHPGCYDLLCKKVDKVHAISNYLREKAVKMGLSENVPYAKITPAIELSKFTFKNDSGEFHSPIRIITVGRLNWIKDYETAITSLGLLKKNNVSFVYEIIGEGSELERIRFAVHQADISDKVVFCGKLSHEETLRKMQSADLYLQTSMQEGFCVSALEAQAVGLVCIVSDADGLKENVIDGVTGLVAERRNPESICGKLMEAINMTEPDRIRMTTSARMRIEKEFNIDRQKDLFDEFFTDFQISKIHSSN
jgi:colanic acid/amylovoran biosynthesis glycosyltransferase